MILELVTVDQMEVGLCSLILGMFTNNDAINPFCKTPFTHKYLVEGREEEFVKGVAFPDCNWVVQDKKAVEESSTILPP